MNVVDSVVICRKRAILTSQPEVPIPLGAKDGNDQAIESVFHSTGKQIHGVLVIRTALICVVQDNTDISMISVFQDPTTAFDERFVILVEPGNVIVLAFNKRRACPFPKSSLNFSPPGGQKCEI